MDKKFDEKMVSAARSVLDIARSTRYGMDGIPSQNVKTPLDHYNLFRVMVLHASMTTLGIHSKDLAKKSALAVQETAKAFLNEVEEGMTLVSVSQEIKSAHEERLSYVFRCATENYEGDTHHNPLDYYANLFNEAVKDMAGWVDKEIDREDLGSLVLAQDPDFGEFLVDKYGAELRELRNTLSMNGADFVADIVGKPKDELIEQVRTAHLTEARRLWNIMKQKADESDNGICRDEGLNAQIHKHMISVGYKRNDPAFFEALEGGVTREKYDETYSGSRREEQYMQAYSGFRPA